jgi:tetratricopeptide (TPR) repeat protein
MNKKLLFVLAPLLLLAGLIIYGKTFGYGFVFDDFEFIVTPPCIKNFSEMDGFWKMGFPKTRLITLYSFAANYYVNGLNASGYHVFNFIIHILTGFGIWHLAHLLLNLRNSGIKDRASDNTLLLAFFAALIFVVHPVQTQAITYITQRFSAITTFFYIFSLIFYLQGRLTSGFGIKRLSFWSLSLLSAVGAILSKEEAFSLPFMVMLMELMFFSRAEEPVVKTAPKGKGKKEVVKVPATLFGMPKFLVYILAVTGTLVVLLLIVHALSGSNLSTYLHWKAKSESHDGDYVTTYTYLLTQTRVIMTFLRLLILPVKQTLEYDYPLSHSLFELPVIASILGIFLLIFTGFKLFKRSPLTAFGIGWVLLTFSVNLIPRVNVLFEHKLYLISFGFCIAAVAIIDMLIKERRWRYGVLSVLIVILGVTAFKRNDVWRTELSLWQDVVAKSPNKSRPNANIGKAYLELRDYPNALRYLDRAIELNPKDNRAITNRGSVYFALHNYDKALENYNQAMAIDPNYFGTFINRGLLYMETGQLELAKQDFDRAVAMDPKFQYAYVKRGNLLRQTGKPLEALEEFNKALSIDNVDLEALIGRAITYFDLKETEKAIKDFNQAIAIAPANGRLYLDRGFFYLNQGDIDKALADFESAIKYDPNNAEAYTKRGMAWKAKGLADLAMEDFNKALSLNPGHIVARNNRMAVYFERRQFDQALEDSNKAIEYAPHLDYTYKNRGMILQSLGKLEESIKDFTTAIEKNPSNSEPYFLRGNSYFLVQKFNEAFEDFSKVVSLQGNNAAAYNNRGIIKSMQKQFDSAIEDFDKAIGINSAYSAPYWGKALALAGKEQYKDALSFANKASAMAHPVDKAKIQEWEAKLNSLAQAALEPVNVTAAEATAAEIKPESKTEEKTDVKEKKKEKKRKGWFW